jgi:hypothetical protein
VIEEKSLKVQHSLSRVAGIKMETLRNVVNGLEIGRILLCEGQSN